MKIEFTREGGIAHFPGLSAPVTLETDSFSDADAQELQRLLDASSFFELPARPGAPRSRGADYFQYTIHVESGDRAHTVYLRDPVEDPDQRALLDFLTTKVQGMKKGG